MNSYSVGTKVKSTITGHVGEIVRVFHKARVYEVLVTEPDAGPRMRLAVFDDVEKVQEKSVAEPTVPGVYALKYNDGAVEYVKKVDTGFYYVIGSDHAYTWKSFPLVKSWIRLD